MKPPELRPLTSSRVQAVGHDAQGLWVRFHGRGGVPGALYLYRTAGPEHFEHLSTIDSPGRYFQHAVQGVHDGERMDGGGEG